MEINKEDFLAFTIEYLLNNPDQKENFYEDLLNFLHQGDIITTSDLSNSNLIKQIVDNIDWDLIENPVIGEDIYFNGENGLYTSLKDFIIEKINTNNKDYKRIDLGELGWDQAYWNDSVAKLLQIMAQKLDLDTTKAYENSGLLIEIISPPSAKGEINTEYLRGSIIPTGAVAELRIVDILNADAANNFINEDNLYQIYRFYENIEINNNKGHNVLFDGKATNLLVKMETEEQLSGAEINRLNGYIKSGVKIDNGEITDEPFSISEVDDKIYIIKGDYINLKVVSKPWVVPWYNIDGDSYYRVREEDKKISALTNKSQLDFTRKRSFNNNFIRLILPRNKRKVEIEDLNRNFWVIGQVVAGISITLFDDNGPLKSVIKGVLKEIGQIWENIIYLQLAMALLSQEKKYNQTHSEVVMLSCNEYSNHLKYDNFDNIVENYTDELNYLITKYSNYNLIIMPAIRLHNYEQNYYRAIKYPGIWVYDRNKKDPSWKIYSFNNSDGITIDMRNYINKSYGINEEEEVYDYIYPVENADTKSLSNKARYYNLGRDIIDLNLSLCDNGLQGNVSIKIEDVGEFLIENNQNNLVEFNSGTIDNENFSIEMVETQCVPKENQTGYINITQGYYQGELLSHYKTAGLLSHEVEVIYVELMPEYLYTHMNTNTYRSIENNAHDYISDKALNADLVLQKYFEVNKQNEADMNKIYILVGHFYYSNEANGKGHKSAYYYIQGSELVKGETVYTDESHVNSVPFLAGPQGVDVGLVLYVPDTDIGRHTCYTFSNQDGSMWAYSDYQAIGNSLTPNKPFFRGNGAYRIELYLKNGETVRRKTNWLIKYITLACISGAANSDRNNANAEFAKSFWDRKIYNVYCHNWKGNANYYNINERIFSYYIYLDEDENPKLAMVRLERDGIDNEDNKVYDGQFIKTEYGNVSIIDQYWNPNIQTNIDIQGAGPMLQVLDKNTAEEINPINYSKENWPQYDQYPNNGYYNPYGNTKTEIY